MVLGELYLSFFRGDEENIGGHKKRCIKELLEQEKSLAVFNMTVLRG
jgi:hypothetical protein